MMTSEYFLNVLLRGRGAISTTHCTSTMRTTTVAIPSTTCSTAGNAGGNKGAKVVGCIWENSAISLSRLRAKTWYCSVDDAQSWNCAGGASSSFSAANTGVIGEASAGVGCSDSLGSRKGFGRVRVRCLRRSSVRCGTLSVLFTVCSGTFASGLRGCTCTSGLHGCTCTVDLLSMKGERERTGCGGTPGCMVSEFLAGARVDAFATGISLAILDTAVSTFLLALPFFLAGLPGFLAGLPGPIRDFASSFLLWLCRCFIALWYSVRVW
mmetsp:Transcript_133836/g.232227  ORF Transcript_133836/g.232227 Transcript_133836/m.232227 type:complete len:267 (+) Transcript_133836:803-1603(+)